MEYTNNDCLRQSVTQVCVPWRISWMRLQVPAALAASILLAIGGSRPVPVHAATSIRTAQSKCDQVLASRLMQRHSNGWSAVIIKLDGPMTAERQTRLKALHVDLYRHMPIINSVAVRLPLNNLTALAALPWVQHLSSDGFVRKNDAFTVASSGADVAGSQYNVTGCGVTVAVLDSGIQDGNDLSVLSPAPGTPKPLPPPPGMPGGSRLWGSVSFVPGQDANDLCGHGTHIAGIIAGNGKNSTGDGYYRTFYGIAPQANVVNVRVLDQNGQGSVSSVVAGINWVVTNRTTYRIRVLNLSMGHPVSESYTTDPLCQAVEAAWKAGIVVVCAAGNQGRLNAANTSGVDNEGWGTAYGSIASPGNDPFVITVGATKSLDGIRADDRIATYSSRGPSRLDLVLKPDLVAPGNRVVSLEAKKSILYNSAGGTNDIPLSFYQTGGKAKSSNNYFRLSGTSMACPVVSGAAVLLIQANPGLSPDTVKARLMLSADKWAFPDGTADPCTFGAGYLNIPAALACTLTATQPALSPMLSEDTQGNVSITMDRAVWGTGSLWGTGITDQRAVWGTRAVWDTNTNILTDSRAVWGTSVWSNRAVWGTSADAVDLSSIAIAGE